MKRYWVHHNESDDENAPDWRVDESFDDKEQALLKAAEYESKGFEIDVTDSLHGQQKILKN